MGTLGDAMADPAACAVEGDHFRAWWHFWGPIDDIVDECGPTRLFGFENESDPCARAGEIPEDGAVFGFVARGVAEINDGGQYPRQLGPGEWFSSPRGVDVALVLPDTRVIASQRLGFNGVRAGGGPVEEHGRLRYIDGCSDSLLACPPVKGDPCFNHLHFPGGIQQTEHYHPSVRTGTVASGIGWCETPLGLSPLVPGMAFVIPTGGLHRFLTEARTLDVIAYHPDSDWGPTDDDHPMINRTWVGGTKLDNTTGVHTTAQVEERWLGAVRV